jgi:ferrous iron transport protein A
MGTTLADVDAGASFAIEAVDDDDLRAKLRRLGFLDGRIDCRHRLHNGPVIVSHRGTDLALGATVATAVQVREVDET